MNANKHTSNGRRRLLKGVTGTALGAWTAPVVTAVTLPAHAQTTATTTASPTTAAPTTAAPVSLTCVSNPPNGSTISSGASERVDVMITITPNPGAGVPVEGALFCDNTLIGNPGVLGMTDSSGQLSLNGLLPSVACIIGNTARFQFSAMGAIDECSWIIGQ